MAELKIDPVVLQILIRTSGEVAAQLIVWLRSRNMHNEADQIEGALRRSDVNYDQLMANAEAAIAAHPGM